MAKKGGRGFLNSLFYIIMSVMAMNFLALCVYLVLLNRLGFCSIEDYKNIMQVLVGNRQYVLNRAQIAEYNKLLADKKAAEKGLDQSEGTTATRQASADALRDMIKQLEEKNNALRELRADHEQKLAELRTNIESLKAEYIKERNNLDDWKKESTQAAQSERYKQMTKTLRAMEPDTIASLFAGNMQAAGGAEENARLIRQYLTPEITAEVLAVLPEQSMRQIVPLLENKYAGMTPGAVAKAWTTPGNPDVKTPEQMAVYMRNMSVPQAFTIFTLLDPKTRAELVRLLRVGTGDEK